jgi:hypothetical protein
VKIGEIAFQFDQLPIGQGQSSALIELGLRLDPLRTLIVQEDADASAVAGVVDAGEISHVVVRSLEGPLVGIVVVDWTKEQVGQNLNNPVNSLQDAVAAIYRNGIRGDSYHHEWLTMDRPPLVYCRGGHWADADPCSQHKP